MTAPRTGLFQRKGASDAPASSNHPEAKVSEPDGSETTPGKEGDGTNEVTCPQCGCQFDPADVQDPSSQPPMDGGSGDDSGLSAQIAAMMGAGAPGGASAGQ